MCRAAERYRSRPIPDDALLIMLSQECDIAQSKDIEIGIAQSIKLGKEYDGKKKSRNLAEIHLRIDKTWIALSSEKCGVVERKILEEDAQFVPHGYLNRNSVNILNTWRARRYTRVGLPSAFDKRFFREYVRSPESGFESFLEQFHEKIDSIYASIFPSEEEAPMYWVSLLAVLSPECSKTDEDLVRRALQLHIEALNKVGGLSMIQASDCMGVPPQARPPNEMLAASPSSITLMDLASMVELRLDMYCWPDEH